MEASAGLVAGSHNRNELVLIRGHEEPKPLRALSGQVCEICGDEVGLTVDGDLFVACNECGFPVCRPCYEYERREGTQNCPQCKTRYKRLKGSPRVAGDEDEEDIDDLEHEFNIDEEKQKQLQGGMQNSQITEAMLHGKMSYGRGGPDDGDGNNTPQMIPPIITGSRSVPVSGEFPITNGYGHGELSSSLHKRIHPYPVSEPGSAKWDEKKEVSWKERMDDWKSKQGILGGADPDDMDADVPLDDEARQPLSRKVSIASSKVNPYRMVIVVRLVVLAFFLRYRILHPVPDAIGLWLVSIICEIWFALSWILDQFPKWFPIDRETYLDRLSLRYEREGEPSLLSAVDLFVSTVDPLKEPPLVTANTVLSILAVDYPVDKVSCYVSDDGASMLTFEALSETAEFARKWVPFCKKFGIEPRAPEFYFSLKVDYLKDKVQPTFVQERRAMKREYEEFKVRINALVAKAMKVPAEGWIMKDGTPWPGNNTRDHPGMIQVFLGHSGGHDTEGNELPRLVYVSREKRPGFQHHKKAGAMNALVLTAELLIPSSLQLGLAPSEIRSRSSNSVKSELLALLADPRVRRADQRAIHAQPGLRSLHQQQQGHPGGHVLSHGPSGRPQGLLRAVPAEVRRHRRARPIRQQEHRLLRHQHEGAGRHPGPGVRGHRVRVPAAGALRLQPAQGTQEAQDGDLRLLPVLRPQEAQARQGRPAGGHRRRRRNGQRQGDAHVPDELREAVRAVGGVRHVDAHGGRRRAPVVEPRRAPQGGHPCHQLRLRGQDRLGSRAGLDLRFHHGGHPDGVQDALPRVALRLLHAEAGGVQGVGAHQPVGPPQPGAPVGAGVRGDLLQPAQPAAVRLQERQPQVARALRLHQHHHLPLHLAAAPRVLHPPRRLPPHRQVHHAVHQHLRQPLLHRALHVHLRHGHPGDALERGQHRGVVEERAVLGHRRRVGAPLRRRAGPAQGAGRHRHQLHRHLQGHRRRGRRVRRALRLQVDHAPHPAHHAAHHQHHRRRRRHLRRHQQRIPVLGPALRQALLRLLGHRPPLPVPQGPHGPPEQDAHHRRHLVRAARLHLLPALGQDRPLHRQDKGPRCQAVWHQLLMRAHQRLENSGACA